MRFQYLEPTTVGEAISILSQHKGKAKVIAGSTDLVIQIRNRVKSPQYVVDITDIPDLGNIRYDEREGLVIGALATIRKLETSIDLQKRYPIIPQAASQLGSIAIRNVATVGGNLCNALPSAEMSQARVALEAKVKIIGPVGERVVPLEEFFTGVGTTVLKSNELLVEIQVPVPSPNTKSIYQKHSQRGTIDLAIVNVAVVITLEPTGNICKDIKIVLGTVAPTPIRARKAEEVMMNKPIDDAVVDKAAQAASDEAHPRAGSIRGSVEYKKEMVKVLTRRLIKEAISQPA